MIVTNSFLQPAFFYCSVVAVPPPYGKVGLQVEAEFVVKVSFNTLIVLSVSAKVGKRHNPSPLGKRELVDQRRPPLFMRVLGNHVVVVAFVARQQSQPAGSRQAGRRRCQQDTISAASRRHIHGHPR